MNYTIIQGDGNFGTPALLCTIARNIASTFNIGEYSRNVKHNYFEDSGPNIIEFDISQYFSTPFGTLQYLLTSPDTTQLSVLNLNQDQVTLNPKENGLV